MVAYSLKRNKCVVLLSSKHTGPDIDAMTGKPEVILTHNSTKGGADHLDQMCGVYTTRKHTRRWPKSVFQHMINATAFNSFILGREVNGNQKSKWRQFLKRLGAELCGGEIDKSGNIHIIAKGYQKACD